MDTKTLSRIENFLSKDKDQEYYKVKDGFYHASECGQCLRFIYLSRIKPIEDNPELKKIYLIGNIFHDFFEKELFKDYTCEKKIIYINPDFQIVGKADAFNDQEVLDFKTCKNVRYIFEPKKEHIIQLNIYMKILGLKQGRIIFIDKNDLKIKEFEVEYDEELFKETINKLKFINKKLKEKADFKEINIEAGKQCFYCKYAKTCFPKQW